MTEEYVRKAPLTWWIGGLALGLTQVLAVGLRKPLGVSTEFVVADAILVNKVSPEYVNDHPVIKDPKYRKLGYGWWLDLGLICGAAVAAVASRRWQLRANTIWWRASHGRGVRKRLVAALLGGFLILLGARLAHGCTSGQFASGWAQLSLSVLPFTITLFGAGMLVARLFHPTVPRIER